MIDIFLFISCKKVIYVLYIKNFNEKKILFYMFILIKKVNYYINNIIELYYYFVFIYVIKFFVFFGRILNNSFELYYIKLSLSLIGGLL